MHSPFSLLRALTLLLALGLVPFAVLAFCCVVTWQGKTLFLSLAMLGFGPLLWWIGDERGSDLQLRWSKILMLAAVLGLAVVAWQAPDGHASSAARVHSRYANGGWHYDRLALGNVLPEIDQIHLGYAVAALFDPLFNRRQLRELSGMTDAIYAEIAKDAEFAQAGSGLPAIYREVSFANFRDGHYFHYIPASLDRAKPAPALVFLHGSGGNFKAYLWLLAKVADEAGCTVVLPSFGLGEWEKRGGYQAIAEAVADAGRHAAIDPDQIHLMGLSNGGRGVCLAESAPGPHFRSLIFLSPVFHSRVTADSLAARLQQRPALVMSGGSDDRVPWDYVNDYAIRLRERGMDVTIKNFPDDDHFLFFRRRSAIQGLVVQWLKQLETPGAPAP